MNVIILGGGITGLALALSLEQVGIPCRIYEAVPAFRKLGIGINLMPHAAREMTELGLAPALDQAAVATREMRFYNRFGQFVYSEPRGHAAGYDWAQYSVHRGELHAVQLAAVNERLGSAAVVMDHRCVAVEQDESGAIARFANGAAVRGDVIVACDGVHSVVRHQHYPDNDPLCFQGINMWRGATRWKSFLGGATMVQAGWLDVGKLVIYPITPEPDALGRQLINWTAEIRSGTAAMADWNGQGRVSDILHWFRDWSFEWLDVPAMLAATESVLLYPMVDREPLPRWSFGRITLVGDAAHPMYPRGGNGAGQGILDTRALAGCLARDRDPVAALAAYDAARREAANAVVMASRNAPPDTVLRLVHERTGDQPFSSIDAVIPREEMREIADRYKRVAGFERETLRNRPSLVTKQI